MRQIPKLIHYVWVGNEMPEKHKNIITTNKKVATQYEFVLWDEEKIFNKIKNDPIEPFIHRAYKDKKYAFLSDAIKLFALQKYGGWSIDADVEIVKPLDDFESYNCVSGFESTDYAFVATLGSIPNHKFINLLLSKYYDENNYDWLVTIANTGWVGGDIVPNHGNILKNNTYQYSEELDVHVFPSYVFCGTKGYPDTYTVHHFTGSWL